MSPVRVCHSPYVSTGFQALLVHGHLAVELHVVEHGHLLRADHGIFWHLVRVEPGEVHVRDAARREAEEAEHDVLDARLQEVAALGGRLDRVLVEQEQDHGEVVDAERPERVLVRPDAPQVLAVAVDAEHVAERTGVDESLSFCTPGW